MYRSAMSSTNRCSVLKFSVLATEHPLSAKRILYAADFTDVTLITYPVPEDRLDLILHVLKPVGDSSRAENRRTDGGHFATGSEPAGGSGIAELGAQELR
jgi:hypothetical protein